MIRTRLPALLIVAAVLTTAATFPPAPGASARDQLTAFGRAVAIAGDVAFVGEPNVGGGGRGGGGGGGGGGGRGAGAPAGTVHVYRRGVAGWKEVDQLVAPASGPGDAFGVSLATDGATLLVGQVPPAPGGAGGRGGGAGRGRGAAPLAPPVDSTIGSVDVFRRGADGKWTAAGTLNPTASRVGLQFGVAVVVAGDFALVGAPSGTAGGAVFVFRRSADGDWAPAGALPAQGLTAGDRFGAAIAMDSDRAVVGAPGRQTKGSVFVFRRAANGLWSQETEQLAPRTAPDNAQLGAAVAVKGDRVVAGAPAASFAPALGPSPAEVALRDSLARVTAALNAARGVAAPVADVAATGGRAGGGGGRGGGAIATGMVMVYERTKGGSWRASGTLAPFDLAADQFGAVVATEGDELWIGAPGSDGSGRIYRARQDKDGDWSAMTKLAIDDSADAGAQFAAAFAIAGDAAVIGMPGDGRGAGTVAFLGKSATGTWTLRSLTFPPVPEPYAAVSGKEVKCTDGKSSDFECSNVGLLAYMPISAIGGKRGIELSGSWGWTDPLTGKDYALIGRTDGTAFVDVSDPVHPRYLGDLMRTKGANISVWREMKTYKNYAFIISDGSGDHHGIQIFDLTHLRGVITPKHFVEDAHYDLGSIHDIAINQQSGYAYALGTNGGGESCSGGLHMIDIHNPLQPKFVGCFADVGTGRAKHGYTHDAQCVTYHGPDTRYTGHEICMAANETTVSIQDVTDKQHVKVLAHGDYPTVGYTHQGWFTDDQHYWYLDDELDEGAEGAQFPAVGKAIQGTRTMVWDMADLENPVLVQEYIGPTHATDHNQYVKGNRLYQSNYEAGLRILDITDPRNPHEVGYFDTTPGRTTANFNGSWNNYPFFKNGAIGVVSIGEGFFLIKDRTQQVVP